MSDTITIKIGAIQKINFILDDHQKLINMCGMPDIIKHSLHKDVVTVRHILQNGNATEKKGGAV
jgi:hypothetical protein